MHHSPNFISRLASDATINLPLSACPGTAQREKFLLHLQSAVPRKFLGTYASTLLTGDFLAQTPPPSEASPSSTSRSASPCEGPHSPASLQRCEKMSGIHGVHIIHEIYDGECSEETFERELDLALEAGFEAIIVEPARLGEETARWIRVGNCLHRCTVLFGLSSICLSVTTYHNSIKLVIPLTMASLFCAGLYTISWQSDPCCRYQMATGDDLTRLASSSGIRTLHHDLVPLEMRGIDISAARTVLVRRDRDGRTFCHAAIVSVALALAVIRFYT